MHKTKNPKHVLTETKFCPRDKGIFPRNDHFTLIITDHWIKITRLSTFAAAFQPFLFLVLPVRHVVTKTQIVAISYDACTVCLCALGFRFFLLQNSNRELVFF